MDELDLTAAERKVTYEEIKDYMNGILEIAAFAFWRSLILLYSP